MSLFSTEELNNKQAVSVKSGSINNSGSSQYFSVGKSKQKIEKVFGNISFDQTIHYVSMGDWSTHDLILFILKQIGPSRVYFTTWAISEFAIRQLWKFINDGLIIDLNGLFDYRNGIRKPAVLQLLKNITTNSKAAKCHAKVAIIENELMAVSIVGSANLTNNPRIEAGVISTVREVA